MTDMEPTALPQGQADPLRTPTPAKLTEHGRYVDAQQSVDQLSDAGFPMSNVTIVWSGLRHIEHVTGRRTVATAARDGLLSGAWFGLIIGIAFASFSDTSSSVVAMAFTYSIVGALTVASFQALQHWARRGTRDFSTIGRMDATSYEIWVDSPYLAQAQQILGVTSERHMDPTPTDPSSTQDEA